MAEQPYWEFLFHDFVMQTDPAKIKARLDPLEAAIHQRMQELASTPDSDTERRAIDAACNKLLEIKTQKIGYPPIFSA
jgi:hypothetical protein